MLQNQNLFYCQVHYLFRCKNSFQIMECLFLISLFTFGMFFSFKAHSETKIKVPATQVYKEINLWQQEIENTKTLSITERKKELEFITQLKNRLDTQTDTEFDLSHFKSSLDTMEKNSKKGANALYLSDGQFLKQSQLVIDELEPHENPVQVLKGFLRFASIEKSNEKEHSAEEFAKTRSYINKESSLECDPVDLDEAANVIEQKIFHLPFAEEL